MEVSLIRCKTEGNSILIEFAGAGRPLWIQRSISSAIDEIKGTKAGIGGSTPDEQIFTLHRISLQTGDALFLLSDGYPDQFSESSRRKITTKRLKEKLEEMHSATMQEKGILLEQYLINWQGKFMQLDDILVVGIGVR
jgi:serine phosphatase RsbU (regulator of sigma subunit)